MSPLDLLSWLLGRLDLTVVVPAAASSGPSAATLAAGGAGAVTAAILGAALVHRYTLGRERRSELTKALDALVQGYVVADRAIIDLYGAIEHGNDPSEVQASADRVSDCETVTRGAHRSIALRLNSSHPVVAFYEVARDQYQTAWLALGPAIGGAKGEIFRDSLERFRIHYGAFQRAMEAGSDEGRKTVGEVDRWRRRRHDVRLRLESAAMDDE